MDFDELLVVEKAFGPMFKGIEVIQHDSAKESEWLGRAIGLVGSVAMLGTMLLLPLAAAVERIVRIAVNIFGAPFSGNNAESCSFSNAWDHLKKAAYDITIGAAGLAIEGTVASLKFAVQSLIDPKNVKIYT